MQMTDAEKNNMGRLTRRSVVGGLAALGIVGAHAGSSSPSRAASRLTPYGVAVGLEPFRHDPLYRQALIEHADIIVPMNMLKWASLRYDKGKIDFERADEIVSFARAHGKSVRGHTLLWSDYNPKWVDELSSAREAERVLVNHIEQVVDHYRGIIPSWDVVNEVVAHDPLEDGDWRKGIWQDLLGARHVEIAFRAAARTDPTAKLVINEYDLENTGLRYDARRNAILNIVRNLQDQNIPVHGVGLQAHLYAERAIDQKGLGSFIQTLEQMGVKILITELDVIDWRLSRNPVKRDIGVANVVAEFLEAVYAAGRPESIVTWGITDRYSWIKDVFKRKDGAPNRPLPMDRNYRPKPFMDVLQKYRIL